MEFPITSVWKPQRYIASDFICDLKNLKLIASLGDAISVYKDFYDYIFLVDYIALMEQNLKY